MPGKGPIESDEKWVITIEVAGERSIAESNRAQEAIKKLVARLKKPGRNAKWSGKTKPK
jgi:hypothetical protein